MFRSLRWRIQAWYAAILAVVIVSFAAIIYWQQRRAMFQQIDDELDAAAEVLVARLDGLPELTEESSIADRLGGLQVPNTFAPRRVRHRRETPYFVIWSADRTRLFASNSVVEVPSPVEFGELSGGNRRSRFRQRGPFREVNIHVRDGLGLTVGRMVQPDQNRLDELLLVLVGVGGTVFVVGLVGGWWFSSRAVQPILEMSDVAQTISAENLSQRINVQETDSELGGLAETFNGAFERLERSFASQRQFTGDASHELRTPLSVILMHQELALSKDRSPEEYREAIEVTRRAAKRMQSLVESLLALARLDADGPKLNRAHFSPKMMIDDAVESVRPLAEDESIRVSTELPDDLKMHGDREQLGQVMTNLLTNAIRHAPRDSHVHVRAQRRDGGLQIEVEDQGEGISPEHQKQVFERFFRVDPDRSRQAGGTGLGLSICKAIVEAHGGKIGVASELGRGSTFFIWLPTESIAAPAADAGLAGPNGEAGPTPDSAESGSAGDVGG